MLIPCNVLIELLLQDYLAPLSLGEGYVLLS